MVIAQNNGFTLHNSYSVNTAVWSLYKIMTVSKELKFAKYFPDVLVADKVIG